MAMDAHAQHHIFLSHSGKQKGFVKDLEKKLSSMGYSVFFDMKDDSLPPGQVFPSRIFAAARTCKIAVVVLSDDFLTSRWPMIELCAFAERVSSAPYVSDDSLAPFTLLPLFLKLSPEDLKKDEKLEEWRKAWHRFELLDVRNRFKADKCEEALRLLPPRNGIIRQPESEQGEASYIEEVADKISTILPLREKFTIPDKKFSARDRLCKIIHGEFQKLETLQPPASDTQACVLGIHGVPGSGKSTLCRFLCDYMYDEFKGNVIYMELPTKLDPHQVSADNQLFTTKYTALFAKFTPTIYIDPLRAHNQLAIPARAGGKMFLVLDNVSPTNYESYKAMLQSILRAAIVGSGSRIVVVARFPAILEKLFTELSIKYNNAITETPCLTEVEAMEIIENQYPSVTEDLMIPLLRKSSFRSSSSMYIPFVFEQIGVLLRTNRFIDVAELENLWHMVDKGKKDAVQKLVDMNFKQLPEELQVLFFDLALFVMPTGHVKLDDAALVLSHMHGITNTVVVKMKIHDLRSHCSLSIIGGMLQIHDIFMEYADFIHGNSESYVYKLWSHILDDAVKSPGPARVHLKLLQARTINIGAIVESRYLNYKGARDQAIHVRVEIGTKAKAMRVKNNSRYYKFILDLSGNLSSLAFLEVTNVWQVVVSPSSTAAHLSNLVRLELTNYANGVDTEIVTWNNNREKKWMNRFFDFLTHQIQNSSQSMKGLLRPLFSWDQWSLTSYNRHVSSLVTSGQITSLRVLILVNAGLQRIEDIGRHCPHLEDLGVRDEADKLMFVSVGNAPKLKRLIIGLSFFIKRTSVDSSWEYNRAKLRPKKSSELVLKLQECPNVQQLWVDVCLFDRVKVIGLLPSKLQHLALANNNSIEVVPTKLISPSGQLPHLEKFQLYCSRVEKLNFAREYVGCMQALKQLDLVSCASLASLAFQAGCLPNLKYLNVGRCEKLHVMEGLENLLNGKLQRLHLWCLPQLYCDVWSGSEQLEVIIVHECHGVKIKYNMLESSKSLKHLSLHEACVVIERKKQSDIINAIDFMGNRLPNIQFISLGHISVHYVDEDIKVNLSEDQHGDMSTSVRSGYVAEKCFNMRSGVFPSPPLLSLDHSSVGFGMLGSLHLEGLEDLREIQGTQHQLHSLYLSDLPNLVRISGKWSSSIGTISLLACPMLEEIPCLDHTLELYNLKCVECPKLKAVVGCFREMKRLMKSNCNVQFVGCESMEVFPMGDMLNELGKRREANRRMIWGFNFSVRGSKFASKEVLLMWLNRDAEFGSYLFEAAVQGLMWEYVKKDAADAVKGLHQYFLSRDSRINENSRNLRYLRGLFFPSRFNRTLFSGHLEEQEISSFKEWISDTFPGMPKEHFQPSHQKGYVMDPFYSSPSTRNREK